VSLVDLPDREQALRAVAPVLADTEEDAGGEGHTLPARGADRVEPLARGLPATAAVGVDVGGRLQHDAHRGVHLAEVRKRRLREITGVRMREQSSSNAISQAR